MAGAATGPEFDPRYDARYQRGWAPGESDGSGPDDPVATDESAAAEELVARRTLPPADPVAPSSPVAPADDPPTGPEADATSRVRDAPVASEASDASGALSPSAPDVVDPPDPALDADAARDADRVIRVALGIAWGIVIASILIGAGLIWSLISVENPFEIPGGGEGELMVRTLAQFVAPSLLSTGLLGMVALLVVDGLRRARRIGPPVPDGGGPAS